MAGPVGAPPRRRGRGVRRCRRARERGDGRRRIHPPDNHDRGVDHDDGVRRLHPGHARRPHHHDYRRAIDHGHADHYYDAAGEYIPIDHHDNDVPGLHPRHAGHADHDDDCRRDDYVYVRRDDYDRLSAALVDKYNVNDLIYAARLLVDHHIIDDINEHFRHIDHLDDDRDAANADDLRRRAATGQRRRLLP